MSMKQTVRMRSPLKTDLRLPGHRHVDTFDSMLRDETVEF
jgi:hypothetical protein